MRAGGSRRWAEFVGVTDAKASLYAEWFVVAGKIISKGLLAEFEVPSILVAAWELVDLEKLFGKKEFREEKAFKGDLNVFRAL